MGTQERGIHDVNSDPEAAQCDSKQRLRMNEHTGETTLGCIVEAKAEEAVANPFTEAPLAPKECEPALQLLGPYQQALRRILLHLLLEIARLPEEDEARVERLI